jgi:Uma2 family endonuclease
LATTSTRLMTFEEFGKLPDHPHGLRYELRHGEPFLEAPPKHDHYQIQQRLVRLLMQPVGNAGEVGTEMGFKPLPQYEYWYADVAFLSRQRWDKTPGTGNIGGSPELVIEVLSPSNTAREMRDRRKFCLETGSREFWIVDLDLREVEVFTTEGRVVTYKSGQEIPLFFAESGGGRLAVDAIFS